MIVPRTSLLFWTALLAVPAAGWLAWAPAPVPLLLLLFWAGGAVFDAWRSRRLLDGLRILAPDTFRLARGREARIDMRLAHTAPQPCRLRVGLVAPAELGLRREVQSLSLAPGATDPRIEWILNPQKRGRYQLPRCHVETASCWRLWTIRGVHPLGIGVFVYPGFLAQRRQAPTLFMRRGLGGMRHQRRFGKGREFEQLRDYQSGDSLDDIHWKATAKRGSPVTKIYQVERTQEVYVAIDASRVSGRPSGSPGEQSAPAADGAAPAPDPLIERYVNSALLLGRAAETQGDRFGLLTFSDRLLAFVRARRGHGHYRACLDAVCRLQSEPVTPDFSEVCSFIRQHLRRRALIVFLTQLDDPVLAETFLRNVDIIRRQHLVLVCMPAPPMIQPLFSDSEAIRQPDDLYAALSGHLRWRQVRGVSDALHKKGIGCLIPPDDGMLAGMVTRYLNMKQRQIL